MRISDWSSDVCSSDLEGPERHRAAVRTDHPVPRHQFDFAGAADDELARSAVYRDQIDAIAVMVGIVKLLRAALDRDRPTVDQLLSRPFLRRQLGRSEEHTSELQSLMRISYAVFCLKKK